MGYRPFDTRKKLFCKMKKFGLFFVFALVLLTGMFSSCNKEDKLALYYFYCDVTDRTAPSTIEDPELRAVYTQLLTDFINDLSKLKMSEIYETNVVDGRFGPEDEKQIAKYDIRLPDLKDLEAKYKKRIEDLSAPDELAFFIRGAFTLSRSTPADFSSTVTLREYTFNLSRGFSGFVSY